MDRIYLIENEVNDRPLNSIICPWMLKSFTIANVDHKPKFLHSHQFWLEIYSGCHLHLFTAWLMCSSMICLKNVEWLSWLSPMGSLPFNFFHLFQIPEHSHATCLLFVQNKTSPAQSLRKGLMQRLKFIKASEILVCQAQEKNTNHWMFAQTTQHFFPPILPSLPSHAQILFYLWRRNVF